MLGEFVTNILVLVLGYAYPAFECFRCIEKNRPDIEDLRFWCQYWIIVGLLTAVERFGDMFVSWLPLYGEAKLAFIIYLWHPKTKGTWYIYNMFLMPYLVNNEPNITRKTQEIMTKSGDLLLFYVKNFTDKGQSVAFDILQYVIGKASSKKTGPSPNSSEEPVLPFPLPPLPTAPPLHPDTTPMTRRRRH